MIGLTELCWSGFGLDVERALTGCTQGGRVLDSAGAATADVAASGLRMRRSGADSAAQREFPVPLVRGAGRRPMEYKTHDASARSSTDC